MDDERRDIAVDRLRAASAVLHHVAARSDIDLDLTDALPEDLAAEVAAECSPAAIRAARREAREALSEAFGRVRDIDPGEWRQRDYALHRIREIRETLAERGRIRPQDAAFVGTSANDLEKHFQPLDPPERRPGRFFDHATDGDLTTNALAMAAKRGTLVDSLRERTGAPWMHSIAEVKERWPEYARRIDAALAEEGPSA